ncbi:MAG: hypothetical protein IPO21_14665 [Bacteroidales bacterium]|nr:hypothetical protein [Bacteroidales bacterium]
MPLLLISQTGINVPGGPPTLESTAQFEIQSTDKGLLIPRLSDAQMTGIGAAGLADQGLLIYNIDHNSFYYYDGTAWAKLVELV